MFQQNLPAFVQQLSVPTEVACQVAGAVHHSDSSQSQVLMNVHVAHDKAGAQHFAKQGFRQVIPRLWSLSDMSEQLRNIIAKISTIAGPRLNN